MGHTRIVVYGKNLELYEYEKNISSDRGKKRTHRKRPSSDGVDSSGEASFSDESQRVGKRKDSAQRASMAFRRLVLSNLGGADNPVLITLTYAENITNLRQGYKDFTAFIESLRYRFKNKFKYIAVPEFQKRGAVHFHTLFWGIPLDSFGVKASRSLQIKNLIDCPYWSHGFVFAKETDGDERLSSYLVKYMSKAFLDPSLKNQKCYVASRNCLRPKSYSGIDSVFVILDDYLGVGAVPYETRQYSTHFLGDCKRSLFFNNPDIKYPPANMILSSDDDMFANF